MWRRLTGSIVRNAQLRDDEQRGSAVLVREVGVRFDGGRTAHTRLQWRPLQRARHEPDCSPNVVTINDQ